MIWAAITDLFLSRVDMPVFLLCIFAAIVVAAFATLIRHILKKITALVGDFGFDYDPEQDIFYSTMDAWQRRFGYCELYDEASAPLSMIIDCEPVRFEYGGKHWLIEFWKGQYGMTTGAEVGVYTAGIPPIELTGENEGYLYNETLDENHLEITMVLFRDGKAIYQRSDRHWWLTGFVLGEFTEPWQLKLGIRITLLSQEMYEIFVDKLMEIGYGRNNLGEKPDSLTVDILFDKPFSKQPTTRTKKNDAETQKRNKLLCETWQNVTGDFANSLDKLEFVKKHNPKLYQGAISSMRGKASFEGYTKIKKEARR